MFKNYKKGNNKFLLAFILLNICLYLPSYSNEYKSCQTIIDSLSNLAFNKIAEKLSIIQKNNNIPVFSFKIIENNYTKSLYLKNALLKSASKYNIKLSQDSSFSDKFEILSNQIGAEYELTDDDFVIRSIKFQIDINITTQNKTFTLDTINLNYKDNLEYDYLQSKYINENPLFKGNIPSKKSNFWDYFTKPVVLISSAALAVGLLFFVRSK